MQQPTSPLNTFWSLDNQAAMQLLSCSDKGLSIGTAEERLKTYGPNTLKGPSHSSAFLLFLSQFKSPITLLLIAAALLSMGLGDLTDAVIILVIILISSCLGFWQEKGAAHAVEELLKMVQIRCRLIRDGIEKEWPMETVVPGDVVILSAGDVIPGDSLLLDSRELFIDEAAFTGETFPVEKNAGVVVLIIFAINVLLHKPVLDSFLFSLALAVGLTPQLLPAIITVNLSAGARAMAKKKVIVKRLSSIENFGSMNILCSDKTGTITAGKVTIKDALDITGQHSEKVLQYAGLNASLQQGFRNPIDEAICAVYKPSPAAYQVQCEIPYDFSRRRLTIQLKNGAENFAITKGALSVMLDICTDAETESGDCLPLDDRRESIMDHYRTLSAAGYRVLGIGYKKTSDTQDITKEEEKDMVFLGFITLFDPPKTDVGQTLARLRQLGVQFKVITGDNALVADCIARQIGIAAPVVLRGAQIRQMSDDALRNQAVTADIFAEVEPNQKERIILSLKKAGNVVGFMGDGINDAPALHTADVGISVDSAVDVAKEAADIVLLEQDLAVLAEGIMIGRKTFTNTMKYVFMATSANFGNMFSMAGASLFLPFLPLLPKQILLTNLLTDFPEMTIATDRVDNVSVEKPHRWDIRFIQRFMLIFGLLSSVFDYLTFGVLLYFMKVGEKAFQTGWFVESVISASLIVLALPFTPLAGLLGFVPLPLSFYGWMLLIVAVYIGSAEWAKQWFYRKLQKEY